MLFRSVKRSELVDTDKVALTQYKRDCTNEYRNEIARVSKVLSTSIAISIIKEYANHNMFYLVLFMDRRGRIYTVGNYLSYQSDQKMLMTMARYNPTLYLFKGPLVIEKWSGRDLPSIEKIKELLK